MVGQTISHYRITEELGGGARGVVYKAEDTRLRRFRSAEISVGRNLQGSPRSGTISCLGLNHANICTIHDLGEHQGQQFIVREPLEGETLKHGSRDFSSRVTV